MVFNDEEHNFQNFGLNANAELEVLIQSWDKLMNVFGSAQRAAVIQIDPAALSPRDSSVVMSRFYINAAKNWLKCLTYSFFLILNKQLSALYLK